MSILFSGDFHANAVNELNHITKDALLKQFGKVKYNKIKYHIILGDGGFLWPKNRNIDTANYCAFAYRPFPVLCVVGNHEPILGMRDLPETDIGIGETVYQINSTPLVAYLKRGKIYTIDGFKFLVLGGALSIDLDRRIPGISWWKEEYWSDEEKKDIFKLLKKDNSFDYVLAHTGPDSINKKTFSAFMLHSPKFNDEVAELNDKIDEKIVCKQWWCGHWHRDGYYFDDERNRGYQYLYRTPIILGKVKDDDVKYYSEAPPLGGDRSISGSVS
jgi:hypothetical protein